MATPTHTMIVSWYSPTNASDETNITIFYDGLCSLARQIPKHNVLMIGGDMNAKISKDENNEFGLHKLQNRNGKYLIDFFTREQSFIPKHKIQKKEKKTTDLQLPK